MGFPRILLSDTLPVSKLSVIIDLSVGKTPEFLILRRIELIGRSDLPLQLQC
jgi:hypothetical protein